MRYSRGEFLRLGLFGGAGLFLPLGVSGCGAIPQGGGNVSTEDSAGAVLRSAVPLPEPFTVPLPVPPVLKPSRSDSTTDYYEITQRVGQAEILPDLKTEVWGYEGILPGPTIETRRGRRAVVRHRNELPVPTAVHLHGGVTPPEHDGFPTDIVMPVGGWRGGRGSGSPALAERYRRVYTAPSGQTNRTYPIQVRGGRYDRRGKRVDIPLDVNAKNRWLWRRHSGNTIPAYQSCLDIWDVSSQ